MNGKRAVLLSLIAVVALLFIFVYHSFDPAESRLFPRCPMLMLTGWKCPGCGSQRALHALLHGDFAAVWHANPMIPILLPFALLLIWIERHPRRFPRLTRTLISQWVIFGVAILLIGWTIIRNLLDL